MHHHKSICAEYHKLCQNIQQDKDNGDNATSNSTCQLHISKNPFINFYRTYEMTHPTMTIFALASHVAKQWSRMDKIERKRFTYKAMMKMRSSRCEEKSEGNSGDKSQSTPCSPTTTSLHACSVPYELITFGCKESHVLEHNVGPRNFSAPTTISVEKVKLVASREYKSLVLEAEGLPDHIKPSVCNLIAEDADDADDVVCTLGTNTCSVQGSPEMQDAILQVQPKPVRVQDNWNQPPNVSLLRVTPNARPPKRRESKAKRKAPPKATLHSLHSPCSSVQFIREDKLPVVTNYETISSEDESEDNESECSLEEQLDNILGSRTNYQRQAKSKAKQSLTDYKRVYQRRTPEGCHNREVNRSRSPRTRRRAPRKHASPTSREIEQHKEALRKWEAKRVSKGADDLGGKSYKEILNTLTKEIRDLKAQRRMFGNLCEKCRNSQLKLKKKANRQRKLIRKSMKNRNHGDD